MIVNKTENQVVSIAFDLSDIAAHVWYGDVYRESGIREVAGSMEIEYLSVKDVEDFEIPNTAGTLGGYYKEEKRVEQTENHDKKEVEACKQAYAEYLMNHVHNAGLRFDTAMINEDDIPELLIMQGGSHVNCVEIYTYYDGKILLVKDYEYGYNGYGGSGSVKYISKQNVILSENYAMGGLNYIDFYSIENHYAIKKCQIMVIVDLDKPVDTYYIDEVEVTKDEYDKKYDEMVLNNRFDIVEKNYDNAMECDEYAIKTVFDYNVVSEDSEVANHDESANSDEDSKHSDASDTAIGEVNVEAEVEQIRTWYYDTQNRLDSLLEDSYSEYLDCYFDGGFQAKIVAKSGYNDWNVSREYYYHNQQLYFVFVHGEIGEYRFYVKDGQLIRSISPEGVMVDFGHEASKDVQNIWNRVITEEENFPHAVNCGA